MPSVPSGYDIAQICLNGHVINSSAHSAPDRNKKFCDKCGEQTITACPSCEEFIKGSRRKTQQYTRSVPGLPRMAIKDLTFSPYSAPAFCENCGKPYPWTEARIRAAKELTDDLDELTQEEKEMLKNSIEEIVRDTPQTQVSAGRFKRLATKAGKETLGFFREILVDVASETAKKMIWPQ